MGSGRAIPALTVRMAQASNPQGTAAMWVRDRLDELFEDFTDWCPAAGWWDLIEDALLDDGVATDDGLAGLAPR